MKSVSLLVRQVVVVCGYEVERGKSSGQPCVVLEAPVRRGEAAARDLASLEYVKLLNNID